MSRLKCGIMLAAFAFCFGPVDARAQVYGTDYLSFEGVLEVLDNPTSVQCQAHGIVFGSQYRITYRFTANPGVIHDALVLFPGGQAAARIVSTQSPNFSLNGASTTSWDFINSYGNSGSIASSSSNLTILSGLNQPVSLGTGNLKILGSINNFNAWSDCNISSVHGAAVAKPK